MVGEQDLAVYLSKFDKKYWLTYKVLDILQKVAFPPDIEQNSSSVQQCTSETVRPALWQQMHSAAVVHVPEQL